MRQVFLHGTASLLIWEKITLAYPTQTDVRKKARLPANVKNSVTGVLHVVSAGLCWSNMPTIGDQMVATMPGHVACEAQVNVVFCAEFIPSRMVTVSQCVGCCSPMTQRLDWRRLSSTWVATVSWLLPPLLRVFRCSSRNTTNQFLYLYTCHTKSVY